MSEEKVMRAATGEVIDFDARSKQILSSGPILSAKDIEVQFTLRGQKLTAIRRCSLDL